MPPFRNQLPNVMWGRSSSMVWGRGLFFLLFLVVVITAVFWVVMMMSRQRRHHHLHGASNVGDAMAAKPTDALRILDERFARGEIDAEEFTKRRELLRNCS